MLYTDPVGDPPDAALPESFRFTLDDGALDDEVQEAAWVAPTGTVPDHFAPAAAPAHDGAGTSVFRWRRRRPVPDDDDFFENVWREYRSDGNIR